jgi:hypothetical protein
MGVVFLEPHRLFTDGQWPVCIMIDGGWSTKSIFQQEPVELELRDSSSDGHTITFTSLQD